MVNAERNDTTRRIGAISGLCLLAVVGNLVLPSLFWEPFDRGWIADNLVFTAIGALVAQVCLLGIWCGLSQQAIKYRLPVTAALVLIGACSYCLGLQLPDWGSTDSGLPTEVAFVLAGAAFGMFALLQIPLWLVRRSTQSRIAIPETARFEDSLSGRQFSVGYLMLWTTLVGVLLVIVRNVLPERSEGGLSSSDLVDIVMLILVYIGLSSLLCIPCVWIALPERPHIGASMVLCGAFIAGPLLSLFFTIMIVGRSDVGQLLTGVAYFEAGLTGTTLAVLLVLRSLGYRVLVVEK